MLNLKKNPNNPLYPPNPQGNPHVNPPNPLTMEISMTKMLGQIALVEDTEVRDGMKKEDTEGETMKEDTALTDLTT